MGNILGNGCCLEFIGVDIKQSDLDCAASEIGPQLANVAQSDRRRMLMQWRMS